MPFELPDLPYDSDALEPVIDAETMEIHHGKHHAGYVKKLNNAVEGTDWADTALEDLLRRIDEVPEEIRTAVRNNGGGHYNHRLFWTSMRAPSDDENRPDGNLAGAIDEAFGSFNEMKEAFEDAATGRFGSGWAWLYVDGERNLHIASTANQDAPISPREYGGFGTDREPLLGIDVWEHAYYLKYRNERPRYVEQWWRVVDWDTVAERFAATRVLASASP